MHVHPDGEFAAEHLGMPFGKTEAWIVVGTDRDDAFVSVGFERDVDAATLERWVREQDHDALLRALNRVPGTPAPRCSCRPASRTRSARGC